MEPELFTLNSKDPKMSYQANDIFKLKGQNYTTPQSSALTTVSPVENGITPITPSMGLAQMSSYTPAQEQLLSSPDFTAYAGERGIDLNTIDADGLSKLGGDFNGAKGDWGYKEWGTAGNLGLGAGQLGLGIASYFENKKTADAQRKLLSQQYASNAEAIADRRANKAALANIKIK